MKGREERAVFTPSLPGYSPIQASGRGGSARLTDGAWSTGPHRSSTWPPACPPAQSFPHVYTLNNMLFCMQNFQEGQSEISAGGALWGRRASKPPWGRRNGEGEECVWAEGKLSR